MSMVSIASLEHEFANKPIFTRHMLEQAAEHVEQARKNRGVIHIDGIRPGVRAKVCFMPEIRPVSSVDILWHKRYEMKTSGHEALPYTLGGERANGVACSNIIPLNNNPIRRRAQEESPCPEFMAKLEEMEKEWETSSQWETVKNRLAKVADQVEIKNIVCIALASRFLREQYTKKQNLETPVIEICAYDPAYQQSDLVLLEKFSPPISVVSNPYHFLAIDEHTLVLCVFCPPSVNNFEVIADLLLPSGPAAIITTKIWDDWPWFEEQKVRPEDVWTPRVGEMLAQYEIECLDDSTEWGGYPALDLKSRPPWTWLSRQTMYTRNDGRSGN